MFSQESILSVHLENDVCIRRKIWWENRERSQEARELSEEPGIIRDRIEQTFEDIWEAQFDRRRRVVDDHSPDNPQNSPHDTHIVNHDEMPLSESGIQDFNPGSWRVVDDHGIPYDCREDSQLMDDELLSFIRGIQEDHSLDEIQSREDPQLLLNDDEMELSMSGIEEEEEEEEEPPIYERPLSKKIRAFGKSFDSLMYRMHLLLNNYHLGAYEKVLNKYPTVWEKGAEGGFCGQVVKIEGSRKGGTMFENLLRARQENKDEQSYGEDSYRESFSWSPSSRSDFSVDKVTHTIDPPSWSSQSQFSTWSSTQGSTWSSSTWDTPFITVGGDNEGTTFSMRIRPGSASTGDISSNTSCRASPFDRSTFDSWVDTSTEDSLMETSDGYSRSDTSGDEADPACSIQNHGGFTPWELQYRPEKSVFKWYRSVEYIIQVQRTQEKIDFIRRKFSGLSDKKCKMPDVVQSKWSHDNRSGSLMYDMHLLLGRHGLGRYESVLNNHPTAWDKHA